MNKLMPAIALAFGTALVASPAIAQDEQPYVQPDDGWIIIDGTVGSVKTDAFMLDYGPGVIAVEMDNDDRDADAYKLSKGDKVRVRGIIDDDFFETSKIEASSVYVEDLGTYFFPSSVDEEDRTVMAMGPVTVSRAVVRGTVTDISDHEFRLNAKDLTIGMSVDVNKMPNNPLDDAGYRQVDAGDEVIVTGKLDADVFDPRRELVADSITIVSADDGRS